MDGSPLYGLDEAKLFRPASTAKLFTTAAAMALLGADHVFTTQVYGRLNAATGTVEGDLVLRGAGDPSFATDDLPYHLGPPPDSGPYPGDLLALLKQLQARGVRRVTGKVLVSDQLFERSTAPAGWADEDLLWGYGALPTAFSIGDDELAVRITPAHPPQDTQADITVKQVIPYLTFTNQTQMVNGSVITSHGYGVAFQPQTTNPTAFAISGDLLFDSAPLTEELALPDPAQYGARVLYSLLEAHDIKVDGNASALHNEKVSVPFSLSRLKDPHTCEADFAAGTSCIATCLTPALPGISLAEHRSFPLATEVSFTLKTSANLHAEVLLEDLSPATACQDGSTLSGAQVVWAWLHRIGLPEHDFVFYDGSGLSTKDLVTPRAEAQLLAYAATQPWFPQWKAALPVGGVDGTLAGRFTQPPLRGHVLAKTGTLGESRALAGYLQCASGREVIFSILDDNHEPGSTADRGVMDRIVEAIAALE